MSNSRQHAVIGGRRRKGKEEEGKEEEKEEEYCTAYSIKACWYNYCTCVY